MSGAIGLAAVLILILAIAVLGALAAAWVAMLTRPIERRALDEVAERYRLHRKPRHEHERSPRSAVGHETFRHLIARNRRLTAILLSAFGLLVVIVLTVVVPLVLALTAGGISLPSLWAAKTVPPPQLALGMAVWAITATLIAAFVSWLAYTKGDALVLAANRAKKIHHANDPELFHVVEEMAIAAGIPMPRIYMVHDPAPNACVTGRDPAHAAIMVTTGLRNLLSRDELQAVIAHEVAHIRNYDTGLMMLVAVLAGWVVMLCDCVPALAGLMTSGSRATGLGSTKTDGLPNTPATRAAFSFALIELIMVGGLTALVMMVARGQPHSQYVALGILEAALVAAIIMAVIAPGLVHLIQFAVSRQRQYLADAQAIELTRHPQALRSALERIALDRHVLKRASRATAHLFFVNPLRRFHTLGDTIFASHPPIRKRIERLDGLLAV
jgi:heat shock protein HtpX